MRLFKTLGYLSFLFSSTSLWTTFVVHLHVNASHVAEVVSGSKSASALQGMSWIAGRIRAWGLVLVLVGQAKQTCRYIQLCYLKAHRSGEVSAPRSQQTVS